MPKGIAEHEPERQAPDRFPFSGPTPKNLIPNAETSGRDHFHADARGTRKAFRKVLDFRVLRFRFLNGSPGTSVFRLN